MIVLALHAVTMGVFMTADWTRHRHDLLDRVLRRIVASATSADRIRNEQRVYTCCVGHLYLAATQWPGINFGTEAEGDKNSDRLNAANKECVKRGMFFAESGSASPGDEWTCGDSTAPADRRALLGCDE